MVTVELVLSVLFGLTAVYFSASYIAINQKLKLSQEAFVQLYLSHLTVKEHLEKTNIVNELSDESTHRENFIKFLSESRDWAFTYIEDVQTGLDKFISNADPIVESIEANGTILDNEKNQLVTAYKELKTLLPQESNEELK